MDHTWVNDIMCIMSFNSSWCWTPRLCAKDYTRWTQIGYKRTVLLGTVEGFRSVSMQLPSTLLPPFLPFPFLSFPSLPSFLPPFLPSFLPSFLPFFFPPSLWIDWFREGAQTHLTAVSDKTLSAAARGEQAVSYTHLTLPTIVEWCRSRWSPYH